MTLKQHRPRRRIALAATVATLAMMFALVGGAGSAAALSGNTTCTPQLEALESVTAGPDNVACGPKALFSDKGGGYNIALGFDALTSNELGGENVAIGVGALAQNSAGVENVASGDYALVMSTGNGNAAFGPFAGDALTSGSNNIDISNAGVAGESGTTRIGTEGAQTNTFASGIFPTHLTGCFVQVTSEGQLGCNPTAAAEGKEGKEGKEGPKGKEGPEGKEVSTKHLKICWPTKPGKPIKSPPCKGAYTEKEVAEF